MREIHYFANLFLGEGIDPDDLKKLKNDLLTDPLLADVYLITRSLNESDQLDIYHSKYLAQKFYAEHPPYIIGITKEKGEAISLVEKLVQKCVAARGDADLIAYLSGD